MFVVVTVAGERERSGEGVVVVTGVVMGKWRGKRGREPRKVVIRGSMLVGGGEGMRVGRVFPTLFTSLGKGKLSVLRGTTRGEGRGEVG